MIAATAPMTSGLEVAAQAPKAIACFVGSHAWLGRIFSVVHFVRKLWHWQRTTEQVYQYFQTPLLAAGDLLGATLAKDSPFLQTATLVAEVISSGLQAENARRAMVDSWVELLEQVKHPTQVCFAAPNPQSPKSHLHFVFPKLQVIMRLMAKVLWHCYRFSMHLMDITDLIGDASARKRASRRLASNLYRILHDAEPKLQELALRQRLSPMPLFDYFGVKAQHIELVAKNLKVLTDPTSNPFFGFGWKTQAPVPLPN